MQIRNWQVFQLHACFSGLLVCFTGILHYNCPPEMVIRYLQTSTMKGSLPACNRPGKWTQRNERQCPSLHKVTCWGNGRPQEDSVIPGWLGWRARWWPVSHGTPTPPLLSLFSDVRFPPPCSFASLLFNLGVYVRTSPSAEENTDKALQIVCPNKPWFDNPPEK